MSEITVSKKDQKRREFILSGKPMAVVLSISLPLMALGAFSYISSVIDTVVVAATDNNAVSSVVMISQIKQLISALGAGFATGSSIIVSRLIGRGEYDKAKKAANTTLEVFFGLAVLLIAVIEIFAVGILKLGRLDDNMIATGIGYFRVQIVSIGVGLFNQVFMGLEKARGAMKNITLINIMSMALKLMFTIVFVNLLHLGTTWVAGGTLCADISVTIYALVNLIRKNYLFKFNPKNVMFSVDFFKPLCSLSIPVSLGKFVFSMGKVIVNGLAIDYGPDAPGALGISNQISGSVTHLTTYSEDSESSIISYNLSQKYYSRMIKVFFCTLTVNLVITTIGFILLTVFSAPISMFFAGDGGAEKAALIEKIFSYERVGIIALGVNSAVNGLIYGLGYTKLSMICNLSRLFVFRIPSMLIMINCFPDMGAESLGIAMLISNVGIGLMSVVIGTVCLLKIKHHKTKDNVKL
ncbi:MAG: MATE family efflux transporter [Oscillospiraceae bacterium]|nr:MATE family efflux transporter [Oscillospiraceae bacterium]